MRNSKMEEMDEKKSILIIDDDPDFRNMFSGILKANGYAPIDTATGKSALDIVRTEVLSAALIDLKLEDMSGLEVLREFKENSPGTACILITGYASQESAIEAVNMGAYSYVTKPVDAEQLLAMIRRAIEKQETEKQILFQKKLLNRVNKVLIETLSCESEEEVARICLAAAEEITNSAFGFIGKVNRTGSFDTLAISNPGWDVCKIPGSVGVKLIGNMKIRGIDRSVLREKKSRIVNDPASHPDRVGVPEGHPPIIRFLGVPLKHSHKTIGMIGLANKESGYDVTDQQAVEALAIAFVEAFNRIRAKRALGASEEKYRILFEDSKDAIVITSLNGKFVDLNQSALDLFDYTGEEIMELNFQDLYVHRVDGKKLQQEIEQKGFVKDFEVKLRKKGGRVIDSLFNVTLRRAADGSILGYQGIIRDVTEKRRSEERLIETLEKLRKAMGGVIQAMARTVEMRDPYTAGHQRRVADLARAISTEIGRSKDRVEGLRMAGAIHDLGKIAVPAEIFNKPGSLTEYEFGLIQSHAQVGHDILKDIDFPWPIAQIVLQHHERMNGSGYPQGLAGEDILMEARILAVADVVEAISSHRPYRPAFNIEQALDVIKQDRGVLYDPRAVDVCVRLFAETDYGLLH